MRCEPFCKEKASTQPYLSCYLDSSLASKFMINHYFVAMANRAFCNFLKTGKLFLLPICFAFKIASQLKVKCDLVQRKKDRVAVDFLAFWYLSNALPVTLCTLKSSSLRNVPVAPLDLKVCCN